MKKKNSSIKIVIAVIAIFIAALVGVGAIFVFKTAMQEIKVEEEIADINELVSAGDFSSNLLYSKLNRTVSSGDYALVEKAIKNYIKDVVLYIDKINELSRDEKLFDILSVDNIREDGPDFEQTKKYISHISITLDEIEKNIKELISVDGIMRYVLNSGLDEDYIDYYEKITIGSDAMEIITSSRYIDVVFDYYVELIKIYEDMVNLLSSNPDGWYIEDDMVYLNTEELLNEYNDIVDRYNKLLKLFNNETSLKNDNNVSTNL